MNDLSLDELMAQFRELEGKGVEKISMDPLTPKTSVGNDEFRTLTRKNMSFHGWSPILFFAGGIFIFTIVLISITRPRFLYTEDTQSFLWKRYFLTICIVCLLLLATIFGLYYYLTKQWFLM